MTVSRQTADPAPADHSGLPRPWPRPTPVSRPFWDGLREGRLLVQRCSDCSRWVHYPRVRCPGCLSDRLAWAEVEPRGEIYAMTVARQPTAPPFADDSPQLIAVVELTQGTRLTTTIVGAGAALLPVGTLVAGVFDPGPDGATLLRFRPLAPAGRP